MTAPEPETDDPPFLRTTSITPDGEVSSEATPLSEVPNEALLVLTQQGNEAAAMELVNRLNKEATA